MKDMKTLYTTAKRSGKKEDINAYREAIQTLLNNDPNEYMLQLEYIINSSIGAETLKPFIEKNGLSIAAFDKVSNLLEKSIAACESRGLDSSSFNNARVYIESFYETFANCFAMFDYYRENVDSDYVETYYGHNSHGIQNRKLIAGMVAKYGESALADGIITAATMSPSVLTKVLEYASTVYPMSENFQMMYEWVYAVARPIVEQVISDNPAYLQESSDSEEAKKRKDIADCKECLENIHEMTASAIVESMRNRNNKVYRESVIMNDKNAVYEYTAEELEAISNLIHFREYAFTWLNPDDEKSINEAQQQIYSLYDEFDGMITENAKQFKTEDGTEYLPVFGIAKSFKGSKDERAKEHGFGKLMDTFTGDTYHHSMLSLSPDMKDLYTYSIEQGFKHESIETNDSFTYTQSIYMCVMFLKRDDYDLIVKTLKDLENNKDKTKYNTINLPRMNLIGKPTKNQDRFICSSFVSWLLSISNPNNLSKDYSNMRPEDITILPKSFYVANIKDRDDLHKRLGEINQRVSDIFEANKQDICEYNNDIPRILLQSQMKKLKTLDKISDWVVSKVTKKMKIQ